METNDKFYAVIRDEQGEECARYELADEDLLDCDIYAKRYGSAIGYEVENAGVRDIVYGGNFEVVLTENPEGVCHWTKESYCIVFDE